MTPQKLALLALAACASLSFTSADAVLGDMPKNEAEQGGIPRGALPSDAEIAGILVSLGSFKEPEVAGHQPMAGEASGKRKSKKQGGNSKARRQGYDGAAAADPTAAPAIAAAAVPDSFEQIKHKAGAFGETSTGVANRFKLITGEISQAHQKIQRIEKEITSEGADLGTHIEIYKKMHKHSRELINLFRIWFTKKIKDESDKIAPVHMVKLLRSPEINGLFTEKAYQGVFDTIQSGNYKVTLSGDRVKIFAQKQGVKVSFK